MVREQLIKKHSEVYFPGNSILAVVGNNEFEEVVEFAKKFCVERKGTFLTIEKMQIKHEKEKEIRSNLEQANLCIGFHFPFMSEKDRYAGEVFAAILGEGMSSKLFTEVREKRGLAYAVKTELDAGKNYRYLMIYVGTDKEKIEEVIDICVKEFKKMNFIDEKELEDGKKQVMGNYDVESEDCAGTAVQLILNEISSNAEDHYKFKEEIKKVSLSDIKKLTEISDYASFSLSS